MTVFIGNCSVYSWFCQWISFLFDASDIWIERDRMKYLNLYFHWRTVSVTNTFRSINMISLHYNACESCIFSSFFWPKFMKARLSNEVYFSRSPIYQCNWSVPECPWKTCVCSIQTFALGSNVWVWIVVCRCGYPRASMTNLDHLLFTGSASRFAEFLVCLWLYLLSCCLVQGCSGLFVILNFFFSLFINLLLLSHLSLLQLFKC